MPISISGDGPITGITSLNTTVSSTELGYLDGTTSAIQTQFNNTGIWQSWTPTWTNLTIGNAIQMARYTQIGKTVIGNIRLQVGTTTSVSSNPIFSLPVTSFNYGSGFSSTAFTHPIGHITMHDFGSNLFYGTVLFDTTITAGFYIWNANSTYVATTGVTSTTPFTWGSTDSFNLYFQYEAA